MDLVKNIEKRTGVDIGYNSSCLQPKNQEGCVGKNGFDKSLSLDSLLIIAHGMKPRPNIAVKAGKNAKWYLKRCEINKIEHEIEKQKWRNTSRCTMFIITWEDDAEYSYINPMIKAAVYNDVALAQKTFKEGRQELVNTRCDEEECPKQIGELGMYPIHVACLYGNIEMCEWLRDHGADLEMRDNFDRTWDMYAYGCAFK